MAIPTLGEALGPFSKEDYDRLRFVPSQKEASLPVEMHRLSTESYSKLAAKMPPIYVDADTTALQASFQLGVQHVLKQLREGWVVG